MGKIGLFSSGGPSPVQQQPTSSAADILATENLYRDMLGSGAPEPQLQALENVLNAQKELLQLKTGGINGKPATKEDLRAAESTLEQCWRKYEMIRDGKHGNVSTPEQAAQELAQAEVTAKAKKTEDSFQLSAQQADIKSKLGG